jgi:two-component system C4-dicarboxylate transport sensor histidine kinase DctB
MLPQQGRRRPFGQEQKQSGACIRSGDHDAPRALSRVWNIREPGVGWWIATIPPTGRDLELLVAANRAAAFGVAARWVLHDLRGPVQSLTLLADLLADPDTAVERLLRESCSHLGRSLDLLSRVLHPPAPAELGPVSVREPVQFISDLHAAGRTGVRLEVAIDPSVQAAAAIERHLDHALLNLVLNATDAVQSQEGGTIRITAGNNGDQVEIVVADNGPGLSPDVVARLFGPGAAGRPATRPPGAGLLVASEVLRLSAGTLAYKPGSEPGARFVLTLPRWRQETARRER